MRRSIYKLPSICVIAALILCCPSCDKVPAGEEEAEAIIEDSGNALKPLELSTKSAEYVNDGFGFTFNFIDQINTSAEGDYIVSPLSMQFLLGMILNGAQGETAAEICKVLGYGADGVDDVNEYVSSMLEQLPAMDKQTTLSIANGIFVNAPYPLKDNYKKTVGKYYDAEVTNLNFQDKENSLNTINSWCAEHTNDLIPKIIDEVKPDILAYHLNALYFKSQWRYPFDKKATEPEIFTDESGAKKEVSMMKQKVYTPYAESDIFSAVLLPYGNWAFSMLVLLPKSGHTVSDITAALSKADWQTVLHSFDMCDVDLWLPKFETNNEIKLNDILSEMGMSLAFKPMQANLSAMSDFASHLDFVKQVGGIKVEESGIEAAAVSGSGTGLTSLPDKVELRADHPFLYLITEHTTGAVLFAGRYSGK